LSLTNPRLDAPTSLPEPAASGFHCDDDPDFPQADAVRDAQAVEQDLIARSGGGGPVASTMRGFQEVALLKALTVARGRDKRQIRQEYLAARLEGARDISSGRWLSCPRHRDRPRLGHTSLAEAGSGPCRDLGGGASPSVCIASGRRDRPALQRRPEVPFAIA